MHNENVTWIKAEGGKYQHISEQEDFTHTYTTTTLFMEKYFLLETFVLVQIVSIKIVFTVTKSIKK